MNFEEIQVILPIKVLLDSKETTVARQRDAISGVATRAVFH